MCVFVEMCVQPGAHIGVHVAGVCVVCLLVGQRLSGRTAGNTARCLPMVCGAGVGSRILGPDPVTLVCWVCRVPLLGGAPRGGGLVTVHGGRDSSQFMVGSQFWLSGVGLRIFGEAGI